jgi:hypothetical protein
MSDPLLYTHLCQNPHTQHLGSEDNTETSISDYFAVGV